MCCEMTHILSAAGISLCKWTADVDGDAPQGAGEPGDWTLGQDEQKPPISFQEEVSFRTSCGESVWG